MKLLTKVGVVATTSAALVGGLMVAAPSFGATDSATTNSTSTAQDCEKGERGEHNHAELQASITGILSDVVDLRSAARGAYYTAYELESNSLPATQPTEQGRILMIRPERSVDGSVDVPAIENGTVTATLGLRADADEGTEYYALYPSDGSTPVLVTVVVDADGVATATASSDLSVAYSATVAESAPEMGHKGMRGERGEGHGPRGMRGGHGHHSDSEVAPNA